MQESKSYNPDACCGDACYKLGDNPNQPCWGNVAVIDEVELEDGDYAWVHACRGHEDYYYGGEYKQEVTGNVL